MSETLEIKLVNFGTWETGTFTFHSGTTLLSGKSGCGKTTLLDAIKFALFDTSSRSIITIGKSGCSVQLKMNRKESELVIYRSKTPNKLVVSIGAMILEGIVAQSYINESFGSADILYLKQKGEKNFLELTPASKLTFLEELSAGGINVKKILEKVSLDLKIIDKEREDIRSELKFRTFVQEPKVKIENPSTIELINPLKNGETYVKNENTKSKNAGILKKRSNGKLIVITQAEEKNQMIRNQVKDLESKLIKGAQDPDISLNITLQHNLLYSYDKYQKEYETLISQLSSKTESELSDLLISLQLERDQCILYLKSLENDKIKIQIDEQLITRERLREKLELKRKEVKLIKFTVSELEQEKKNLLLLEEYNQKRLRLQDCLESEEKKLKDDIIVIETKISEFDQELIKFKPRLQSVKKMIERLGPKVKITSIQLDQITPVDSNNWSVSLEYLTKIQSSIAFNTDTFVLLKNARKEIRLSCPGCSKQLVYFNGSLTVPSHEFRDTREIDQKIRDLEAKVQTDTKSLKELEAFIKYQKDSNEIENELQIIGITRDQIDLVLVQISTFESLGTELSRLRSKDPSRYPYIIKMSNELSRGPIPLKLNLSISEIEILIEEIKEQNRIKREIDSLNQEISVSENRINDLSKKCKDLKIVDKPLRDFVQIEKDIKEIEKHLSVYNQISSLKEPEKPKYTSDQLKIIENNILILKMIDELEYQIQGIDMIEKERLEREISEHDEKETFHREMAEKLSLYFKYLKEDYEYQESERIRKELLSRLENLTNEFNQRIELKELMIKAEHGSIENTIDEINTRLEYYTSRFFSFPLETSITNDNRNISVLLNYKGNQMDYKNLSGGEMDRLILCYTLALAEIWYPSILMLDESISSLDMETTELVVNSIKSFPSIFTLIVAHQVTAGIFDNVLEIKDQ